MNDEHKEPRLITLGFTERFPRAKYMHHAAHPKPKVELEFFDCYLRQDGSPDGPSGSATQQPPAQTPAR